MNTNKIPLSNKKKKERKNNINKRMQALNDQLSDDEIVNIENTSYLPEDMKNKFPNKKSQSSLHSIQSPSTTYIRKEEEHRKLTEAQLSHNMNDPNQDNLLSHIDNPEKLIRSSPLPITNTTIEDHGISNKPSSADLSQNHFMLTDFKIGKGHKRNFSTTEMKGLSSIRNSLLGQRSTPIDNNRQIKSSPEKHGIKRSSLQSSTTTEKNAFFSTLEEANYRSTPNQQRQKSRSINNVNNNVFASDTLRSNHSTAFGSPESLKKIRENFELRTLKNEVKELHIENLHLKQELANTSNRTSYNRDGFSEKHYKDTIETLQNKLLKTEELLQKSESENATLVEQIYDDNDYIEVLEKTVEDYTFYTKELITVINEEVASITNEDQLQTLNERYKIKGFNENKISENFKNIYKLMTTLFTLFVEGNREKQLIQDELLHDTHDFDSHSKEDNRVLLESNKEMKEMIKGLKNTIEKLSLNNQEKEGILERSVNESENKTIQNDSVPKEKLDILDARVATIYEELTKINKENSKNLQAELQEKTKEVHSLTRAKDNLIDTLNEKEKHILIQKENYMKLEDHISYFSGKHYEIVNELYSFCEYFLKELFFKIQTGDPDSLTKPIRKLEKVNYLMKTNFEHNINNIHGNLFAIIKFIEESVDVLIAKFNDDIITKNKAANYKIKKGLEAKWKNDSSLNHENYGTSRSINAKRKVDIESLINSTQKK